DATPSPSASAVSSESVSRRRASGPMTTRSSTTLHGSPSTAGGSAAGRPAASARASTTAPAFTRANPRWRSAAASAAGSLVRDAGSGKHTSARARMLAEEAVGDLLGHVAPGLGPAGRAVHAADL